jgi:hypothetical protein
LGLGPHFAGQHQLAAHEILEFGAKAVVAQRKANGGGDVL